MPRVISAKASKAVTRFVIEDLEGATWVPVEAAELLGRLLARSAIWTGRINGQVVAICGVTMIHSHSAKVWSYLHPDATAHRFWLHRCVKRILEHYVRASEFWRVEADCYTTHRAAHDWLIRLGFNREAEMPLYGPQGELMTRYVWFPRGLLG